MKIVAVLIFLMFVGSCDINVPPPYRKGEGSTAWDRMSSRDRMNIEKKDREVPAVGGIKVEEDTMDYRYDPKQDRSYEIKHGEDWDKFDDKNNEE